MSKDITAKEDIQNVVDFFHSLRDSASLSPEGGLGQLGFTLEFYLVDGSRHTLSLMDGGGSHIIIYGDEKITTSEMNIVELWESLDVPKYRMHEE